MNIVDNPEKEILEILQSQLSYEDNNSSFGVGIVDLWSDIPDWHCIALADDNVPIGACTVLNTGELYKLYASPAHRHKKVAANLVLHVISVLKAAGEDKMFIEVAKQSLPFWNKFIVFNNIKFEQVDDFKIILEI
ncbi:GNAT family N-acetyltransferase [Citrobacter sp. wls619]|uniref:GNAT family N-acetyltransferase n=1 Tax=Citrobacter sp. wls619 TaxID=2576432 RepID=UPI0010C9DD84|nr:GNAT family N-acetyltransferase [Citrobacter sp. wls619]TKV11112.1 GNAT family N-acetyltransferase [Citrobacter sp. wls619]